MIWVLLSAMAALASFFVAGPLFSRIHSPALADAEAVPAVLFDQLDEVASDEERGLVTGPEASAARVEIKRRILASKRRIGSDKAPVEQKGRAGLVVAALFVPGLAFGYYSVMGSPNVPAMAFVERTDERAASERFADLAEELRQQLASDPSGGPSEGWVLLGRTYQRLGQYEAAVEAYRVVTQRPNANAATWSMLAEAIISKDGGIVTPPAEEAIDAALTVDPENPAGIYYKSLALSQSGDLSGARQLLVARIESTDRFYPWMEAFVGQANIYGAKIGQPQLSIEDFAPAVRTAPGPSVEDLIAAEQMNDEDHGAFIWSMVERLATRLEEEPDDLDGWIRIGNAYTVLGEAVDAIAAYRRAELLLGDAEQDDPRHQVVAAALEELVK
jgi:cytochrome c-type biogenesis protein CcmH